MRIGNLQQTEWSRISAHQEILLVPAMSNRTISLNTKLYAYLLKVSLREPAILKRLRDETAKHPRHSMQISPEQ